MIMSAAPRAGIRSRFLAAPVMSNVFALVLAATASFAHAGSAAGAQTSAAGPASAQPAPRDDASIRPFRIHVPEAQLVDLRNRIAATRWPDKETVGDQSQGIELAKVQELVRYWGDGYDWRKAEAKLNALP
jgi:hypothetical protein